MTFVQPEFVWFFAVCWAVYWLVRARWAQNAWLLLCSAVFYGWVHPWFLLPLLASAMVDYAVGLALPRFPDRRGLLVALSMTTNLGLLAYFRYRGFFVENLAALLDGLHVPGDRATLAVIAPVGISFYTFQTMSYTLDVARGTIAPRRHLVDYLLYVSLFPQLVAGPIERGPRLLPQLERDRAFAWTAQVDGLALALHGAVKKLVIADNIAPFVDKVFALPSPAGPLVWTASMAFALQMLADFSGYTDLARGTARMLGFDLMRNFDRPYLSATVPEFWRRWHMSLSGWIRDYLWTPLLGWGARIGWQRYTAATVIAFVLLGLWHGASWNFVLFGAWNAAWMLAYAAAGPVLAPVLERRAGRAAAVAFHWLVPLTVSMMLFRERDPARILDHLSRVPWQATGSEWVVTAIVAGTALALAAPLWVALAVERTWWRSVREGPWGLAAITTLWSVEIVAIYVMNRSSVDDFLYFSF